VIEPAVYDGTRRTLRDRLRMLPVHGDARARAHRLRALLEELDIQCDEAADLHGLDAVLLTSARGTDAMIAARLDDDQRLIAYARLVARLLLGEMHAPLDAKMEYADDHDAPSKREREEERMVMALARAIIDGRLDAAPRPLYEDVPKLTFAFTPRSAARSTLGGFHLWSDFWYKRSNMYRRWRSRRDVSDAISRVCVVLGDNSFSAA
jgi:hypothetical protein